VQFQCGPEDYDLQVARFIRELVWQGRPRGEYTIIAYVVDSDDIFGFGSWKHVQIELPGEEPLAAIRIPYFGVDLRFRGERDPNGASWAGRLYATLEAFARRHEDSVPGMPVELFCVEGNDHGQAFCARRGFVDIGGASFKDVSYRRMVKRAYTD
jgi:hypothetical protein